MEKEVLEIFETAKKAADGGGSSDVERCVDALRRLKDIPITTKLLVDTQVGKRLRSLTKHPHEKIKASATDLKEHWRNAVLEETKKDSKKNHTTKEETSKKIEVKSERMETTKITMISRSVTLTAEKKNSEKVIKAEKVETRKIEKVERVPKEEKKEASIQPPKLTSMIKCNALDRDRIRELVAKALSRVSKESCESDREEVRNLLEEVDACDPIRVAVAVESAMFERLGSSKDEHNAKYRSVNFNLSDSKNIDFRRRVLIGQVKPEEIADMTAEQMASDERKAANRNIKEKALLECERAAAPKASTDQFKCGRCQQRKCTYYQLQTRSADEPMTTFVTCVNCNNHWKFC